jgi:site-specific recombinase XerD
VYTLEQWLEHFVKQKRKSRADKTALRFEQVKKDFVEFLGSRARFNIAAITSKDIADFRDKREAQGLAPSTLNGDIASASCFCASLDSAQSRKMTSRRVMTSPSRVTLSWQIF